MSHLESRLRPEEQGLVDTTRPKKDKNKVRTSRSEDVQTSEPLNDQKLDKLLKIEKGLFLFSGHLLDFLYEPIKAFKWEKFFRGDAKVRLDVVNMFYTVKYYQVESYATVEGKKIPFIV
ncbi:hypothetical protein E6C27_scaffold550G00650 [Cucumis melo var. makuwa]|uniref:Uncharacterized protein n=1 Tax=Cucumis melo var. makuwa TaxID=1194695 RepID=A0A5A7VMD3_CUCMM|nr:hypothetical protein E6C27_scaffold550G00650 [Cucumis melo var. makuwa]